MKFGKGMEEERKEGMREERRNEKKGEGKIRERVK